MKVTVHYTQEFMGETLNCKYDKYFVPESDNSTIQGIEKMDFEMEVISNLCDDPHVKKVWFEYHEEIGKERRI